MIFEDLNYTKDYLFWEINREIKFVTRFVPSIYLTVETTFFFFLTTWQIFVVNFFKIRVELINFPFNSGE